MKLAESTTSKTLINRPDFQLFVDLATNLKGGETLTFRSVWPTSNKQEEVKHYSVTLDELAKKRLIDLLR